MNCSKCGNTAPITCGCETGIPTPPPCAQGTPACPDPDPCAETFDSQCIIYTGDDIMCNQDEIVATNTNIADALNNIVDFFCENTVPVTYTGPNLTCSIDGVQTTVVPTGATLNNALTSIVQLACLGVNPPASPCTCLYEAKVTLTKADIIAATTPPIFGANKCYKEFPTPVPAANEAIEVVSASYKYNAVNTGYTFLSGTGGLSIQVNGLVIDLPQYTDNGLCSLKSGVGASGIYLMPEFEIDPNAVKPNMALGQKIYAVIDGVASSEGLANGTMVITILYKKTTY